jgi:hypothetical protein
MHIPMPFHISILRPLIWPLTLDLLINCCVVSAITIRRILCRGYPLTVEPSYTVTIHSSVAIAEICVDAAIYLLLLPNFTD